MRSDRHEIEYDDAQRSNILCMSASGVHDEDILPFEQVDGRQAVGQS